MAKKNWALVINCHQKGWDHVETCVEFRATKPSTEDLIGLAASSLVDLHVTGYVDEAEYDDDSDAYVEIDLCRPSQVLDNQDRPYTHPEFNEENVSNFIEGDLTDTVTVYHGSRVVVDGKALKYFAFPPTQEQIEDLYDSDDHDHETEFRVKNRKLLIDTWKVCPCCETAYLGKPPCNMQVYKYSTARGTHYRYLCEVNPNNEFSPPNDEEVTEVSIYDHAGKPLSAKEYLLDWSEYYLSEFRLKSKGCIVRRAKPLNLGGM